MLIRITQICGGTTPSHPILSPTILHACLATAGSPNVTSSQTQGTQATYGRSITPEQEDAGEIFTVGRRNSTVVLEDKCVSRRHASIRLLSDRYEQTQTFTQGTLADVEFGKPETPEEIAACKSSKTGVICVVKDCGSKFGTFMSIDEELSANFLSSQKQQPVDADVDDTSDETDDEGGDKMSYADLSEKQTKAAQMLNENTNQIPKFQKLDMNSSAILLPLSHTMKEKKSMEGSSVTILFGPQGSGIKLTLIPLQFTFSRMSSKDQDRLVSRLHTIGAMHCSSWSVHSTHLVAKESKATAKHIAAWASCRPTVTQDYILALLTRERCDDPMPKVEDYVPPGTSQLNIPLEKPCSALKAYRIGVLLDDDSGPLAESAGADVLLIHRDGPDDDSFSSWWEGQILKAKGDKFALAVVESTSKKAAAWMKRLSDLEVRFTNQKNLAKAITAKEEDGMLLMDLNMDPIEKLEGWNKKVTEDMMIEFGADVAEEEKETKLVAQPDDDATAAGGEDEMPVNTRRTKRKMVEDEATEDESQPNKLRKDDEETNALNHFKDTDFGVVDSNQINSSESGPTPVAATISRSKRSRDEPILEKENSAPLAKKSVKSKAAAIDAPTQDAPAEKVIIDEESCDESVPDEDERLSLAMTEDGWYVAAPVARKNYRKKIEDAEYDKEENPRHAAKTARVKGLIVREYIPPAPKTTNRRTNGKKDFKRFRKNHVIRGFTSFNADPRKISGKIRLVSVLPKESERQKELEMKQQELDREQAYADALFNDGGAAGKKGRRSGGSIAGYFTQPKRGRAKHS